MSLTPQIKFKNLETYYYRGSIIIVSYYHFLYRQKISGNGKQTCHLVFSLQEVPPEQLQQHLQLHPQWEFHWGRIQPRRLPEQETLRKQENQKPDQKRRGTQENDPRCCLPLSHLLPPHQLAQKSSSRSPQIWSTIPRSAEKCLGTAKMLKRRELPGAGPVYPSDIGPGWKFRGDGVTTNPSHQHPTPQHKKMEFHQRHELQMHPHADVQLALKKLGWGGEWEIHSKGVDIEESELLHVRLGRDKDIKKLRPIGPWIKRTPGHLLRPLPHEQIRMWGSCLVHPLQQQRNINGQLRPDIPANCQIRSGVQQHRLWKMVSGTNRQNHQELVHHWRSDSSAQLYQIQPLGLKTADRPSRMEQIHRLRH